jgi:hypothetical protein
VAGFFLLVQHGAMPAPIRSTFPAPWSVEETSAGYRVVAANGRIVAFLYGEDELTRREILRYPTMAEAFAIAKAIAALPKLMK